MKLQIKTPRWCLPLLAPCRYKGGKGGRASGKSHFFAERVVEEMIADIDLSVVCVREIQKSLKFSAKKLIETKIRELGVSHLFDITLTEIRRIGGSGICIFQGLQDHTAESIKSLEGFKICWVEEANSLSARSLSILLPTIRAPKSEIWFTWNPGQPDDPVQKLFDEAIVANDPAFALVHVNFTDNPFCPDEVKEEAARCLKYDPDAYGHIWLGEFDTKNNARVFSGKWIAEEFDVLPSWHPMHGLDWGFAQDPTAAVECYVENETLYIRREAGKIGLELDYTAPYIKERIPGIENYVIRADSARPESIAHVRKKGLPRIAAVEKWPGSVEDGIAHIRSYKKVVIHPDCKQTIDEFRLYSYKINKHTGDILPDVEDKHNHYIDAIRYALAPLIQSQKTTGLLDYINEMN